MHKPMSKEGATARFNRLVKKRMARGMSRRQAVRETVKHNPKLHGLMKLEASPRASRGTQNEVRSQHGFAMK